MTKLALLFLFGCCCLLGCSAKEYPAISAADAKQIKAGGSLSDIETKLGAPHSPTATQAKHLADVVSKMPEPMRANAEKDKSLAWGNDSTFLVVKVNDKGVAWVTAWRE